jgi:hypothetical protein
MIDFMQGKHLMTPHTSDNGYLPAVYCGEIPTAFLFFPSPPNKKVAEGDYS